MCILRKIYKEQDPLCDKFDPVSDNCLKCKSGNYYSTDLKNVKQIPNLRKGVLNSFQKQNVKNVTNNFILKIINVSMLIQKSFIAVTIEIHSNVQNVIRIISLKIIFALIHLRLIVKHLLTLNNVPLVNRDGVFQ